MLDLVETEMVGDAVNRRISMASSLAGGARLKPEARKELMREYENDLIYYDSLRLLDVAGVESNDSENSALALVEVYEMLKQVGMIK